jgi:hypothetical protein
MRKIKAAGELVSLLTTLICNLLAPQTSPFIVKVKICLQLFPETAAPPLREALNSLSAVIFRMTGAELQSA